MSVHEPEELLWKDFIFFFLYSEVNIQKRKKEKKNPTLKGFEIKFTKQISQLCYEEVFCLFLPEQIMPNE